LLSLFNEGLLGNHVVGHVVEHFQVGVNEFVVELDFVFGQFVVVAVDLVDQLAVEIDHSFELFPDQASHAFVDFVFLFVLDELFGLVDVLSEGLWGFGAHSEIGVDGHVGVDFE
jgi:hypothetical protein